MRIKKTVKSIKAAYGGYTNGEKECAKIVKDFLNELYNAGIIPWMIGHSKLKTVKDKASLDEEGFQKLGSSLIADYEAAIADCFDIAVTGLIDREIEERGDGDSIKRYVKETERRLYFRSNEIVEAGGRLKDLTVPEYIPFDKPNMAKDFIETVENALKAGRKSLENTPVTPVKEKPTIKAQKEDIEELPFEEDVLDETEGEETISEYPDNLDAVIRKMFKECTNPELKSSVREVISEYGKIE